MVYRTSGMWRGFAPQAWIVALVALMLAGCAAEDERRDAWRSGLSGDGKKGGFFNIFKGGSQTAVQGRAAAGNQPLLVPGNDRFVNETLTPLPRGAQRNDEGVLLNFEEADLREVVATILGDILNENYLYDPRVQGRVTLQTVAPLSDEETVAALELILRQNAGAMVLRDGVYAIVPAAEAGAGAKVPVLADGAVSLSPGFAVLIAPLQSASASELAGVIEPLAGSQTSVRFDANRNVLILTGAASDLASLRETIAMFDVDWLDGLSYGLFPMRNAQAADVIAELEAILGGQNSPIRDQVVLQPVTRMNAVLVVTKRRKILQEMRLWTGRLDKDIGSGRSGVYVYRVENIPATDLAEALEQVFGNGGGSSLGGGSTFANDVETVSVETEGDAPPPAAMPAFSQISIGDDEDVRIFANENSNSLVVRSSPETYRRITSIIRQLDVAPLQVLIDATIAEVQLNNQLDYGVQFFLSNGRRSIINTTANNASISPNLPAFAASYVKGGAEVVLSALDSVTRLNVISTPRIMVLDNQSATLNVGDEVPIITEQQQSTDSTANIINQVTYRETGISLEVQPRVSSSGLVTLDILQETSNVVEDSSSGTLTPTISQRTIESSIAVQNGQTILLGGLISEEDSRSKTGVPVLSDAPVIGGLFGTRRNGSNRTELIVLLTPRVVRNPNEVRDITEELRQRVQDLSPEFRPKNSLTRLRKN
ncbi:type II secretion system secretin GspD [uncultured Roseobacter sp.]|uniref:type II secretion system secretin GspD n=1 Tax=uncultured Roseobacter sp. TaxID=114847 RepID=UPI002619851B|nr:type II secretion system secretin GspD [uncultured Roseobacter sp.]